MKSMTRFTCVLAVLVLASSLGLAQTETGTVLGTVTDPQGAVVSGSTVTLTNVNTGQTRSTTSNDNGLYTFTNLQPGTYDLKVEAANFQATTKRVGVSVGGRNTVDVPLAVSGTTTTVEVVGEGGVVVDTRSQELSQVVGSKQISELPTFNRNPYALVGTAGNVTSDAQGSTVRGAGFSINGQRAASTSILLDGGENVDLFTAVVGQSVPLDSVEEFRVITNNFSAEYGRASGGVVNVATKSGTNTFHGGVFYSYRGAATTSNTFENNANGLDKPNYVRNQFGYTLGGPIWKEKAFFFNSTEWIRVRSSARQIVFVPDPTFITSGAVDPATAAFFTQFGALRPELTVLENDIVAAGTSVPFDRVAYTVPSNAGGGNPQNQYQTVARLDFNFTDRTTMYGRYALQSINLFPGSISDSPYAGFDTGEDVFNNNILVNLTHIWSPNVVTQSKVIFNRLNTLDPLNGDPSPTLYMFPFTAAPFPGTSDRVALPGYLPFNPGSAIPFGGPQNLYQFYQDLSWTAGNHQLRFGGQYIHTRDNRVFGAFENGVETLSIGFDPVQAINNMQNGVIEQFQGAVDPQGKFPCVVDPVTNLPAITPECTVNLPVGPPAFGRNNRYHDFAFYGQDSWKLHPRFTLNLGLRWEYYGVQHNADPNLDSNFYRGDGANVFEQIRNGQVMVSTDPNNPVGGLWEPDWNNFAPRVGFAWDLFGDARTSLRGGYGISYERNFGNVTFNVIQNPPNYAVLALTSGVDAACTPCPITTSNFGPLSGGVGALPLPRTSLRVIQQDLPTAYSHFWSLALERELATNTVLAFEYSGSRGVGLYTIENPNRPGMGVLYLGDDPLVVNPFRRLNDQYTSINQRGGNGRSEYHGLNVRLQSSNLWNSGLTFTSNYTWSHAMDNLSSTFSESANNFNLGLLDPFNPDQDFGNADFDIRHRWVLSAVWDAPWFRQSDNWFARSIIGGWTISPIVNMQTGTPFTVFDCGGAVISACPRYMPLTAIDAAAHDPGAQTGPNQYTWIAFDPANTLAWANPVLGLSDFGDCGIGEGATTGCPFPANMTQRNAFRGPGLWNVDLGLAKNFRFGERWNFQLRADAFNLMNHSNLFVIGSTADFSGGSVIAKRGGFGDSFDERRYLTLGAKITF
jgi:outer membrane receptor protein involved in Fe transport